jgi:dienelactone hydrolase
VATKELTMNRAKAIPVLLAAMLSGIAGPASRAAAAPAPVATEIETPAISATLYYPAGSAQKRPAILVLGGSDGGRAWASEMARSLADGGYVALALTYFGGTGDELSQQLVAVPVERLRAGLDRLTLDPRVDTDRIGVIGFSKGAEAALLLASIDRRIAAVVAASPSDRLWQGIDRRGGAPASSWSIAGAPLSYVPFALCDHCSALVDLYRHSRDRAAPDMGRIDVEDFRGALLMLVSEADKIWPSAQMARALEQALIVRPSSAGVAIHQFPDAGHFLLHGNVPTAEGAAGLAAFGGGTAAGLIAAHPETRLVVSKFLESALGSLPTPPDDPLASAR